MATSRVYSLFQSLAPNDDSIQEIETQEEPSESEENSVATESFNRRTSERNPQRRDARELFNAWNDPTAKVSLMNWQAPRPGQRPSFRNSRLRKAKSPITMTSGIGS